MKDFISPETPPDILFAGPVLAEHVQDCARAFVDFLVMTGRTANFTPESLPAVDSLVKQVAQEIAVPNPPEHLVKGLPHVRIFLFCYIGEVVRRNLGGHWVFPPGGASYLKDVGPARAQLFWDEQVMDALTNPQKSSFVEFYATARSLSTQSLGPA